MNIFKSMDRDKIRVIKMAPMETQSPWRGRRFPKNILMEKATKGRNKISKLKNIKEVAVIGIEDEYYGEVVSAVCVLKKKSNNYETKIRGFLLKSLATFQQPVNYFFVEKLLMLPTTVNLLICTPNE